MATVVVVVVLVVVLLLLVEVVKIPTGPSIPYYRMLSILFLSLSLFCSVFLIRKKTRKNKNVIVVVVIVIVVVVWDDYRDEKDKI